MDKQKMIDALSEIADLLEAKGDKADSYRITAYHNAVRNLNKLTRPLEDFTDFKDIPGIGQSIADKMAEMLTTGKCSYLEELRKACPPKTIMEFTAIKGVGPVGARKLWEEYHVATMAELKGKLDSGSITDSGLKVKVEKAYKMQERIPLVMAQEIIAPVVSVLESAFGKENVCVCGSMRRLKPTVHDADIIIRCEEETACKEIMEGLAKEWAGAFSERITNVEIGDFNIQMILVKPSEWGAAMIHWSGPKEKNVRDRMLAGSKGMMLNDKGLWKIGPTEYVQLDKLHTEEEIHKILGITYLPPELRDLEGDVKVETEQVPADYKVEGDLHTHSMFSDGDDSPVVLIESAISCGYKYIGIADHGKGLPMCGIKDFDYYFRELKRLKEMYRSKIEVLVGIEANIDKEGNLDYTPTELAKLDFVIASTHSYFELPIPEQTARMIKAINYPHVSIIGHPANDVWGSRDVMQADWLAIFAAMKANNVAFELNADHGRPGLDCNALRKAMDMGVEFTFGSDAHDARRLPMIRNAVQLGRRFGLRNDSLIDTVKYTPVF